MEHFRQAEIVDAQGTLAPACQEERWGTRVDLGKSVSSF